MDLKVDPKWMAIHRAGAQILIRAQDPSGKWGTWEIGQLTDASLIEWLRSRHGPNPWMESVVFALLGRRLDPLPEEEA